MTGGGNEGGFAHYRAARVAAEIDLQGPILYDQRLLFSVARGSNRSGQGFIQVVILVQVCGVDSQECHLSS